MLKHTLIGIAAALFIAGPAVAAQCPLDMKKIDEAMSANPAISAEQMAEVKQLRAEGEALHEAGKHGESVDTLAKAKAILGIQ